jgi:sarcosine oxidase, subunit delta
MLLITVPTAASARRSNSPTAAGAHRAAGRALGARRRGTGPTYLYMRANTKGVHAERWRHAHGCGASSMRCAIRRPIISLATYVVGEPRARPAGRRRAMSRLRTPPAVASIARAPLQFTSTAALSGLRRRHAGLGAARQRRASGRPLVQIPPAARHRCRRRRGAERAGHGVGAMRAHDAEPARHAGRTLRRPERRQPEPLAEPRFDVGASTICSRRSFRRASTTRPSCGPRRAWQGALRAA